MIQLWLLLRDVAKLSLMYVIGCEVFQVNKIHVDEARHAPQSGDHYQGPSPAAALSSSNRLVRKFAKMGLMG